MLSCTPELPEEVKERFKIFLGGISSLEIARVEQELVSEGLSREEIQRLCGIHLSVFSEQLEKQRLDPPSDHSISILMEEHKIMLQLAEKLSIIVSSLHKMSDSSFTGGEKDEGDGEDRCGQ